MAAYIAAGLCNEDYFAILKIMDTLKLKIGSHCKEYTDSYDATQIQHATTEATKHQQHKKSSRCSKRN